jgi:hypothetical protein
LEGNAVDDDGHDPQGQQGQQEGRKGGARRVQLLAVDLCRYTHIHIHKTALSAGSNELT